MAVLGRRIMPALLILLAVVTFLTPVLWIYGESRGSPGVRRLGALLMTLSWSASAVAGTILASMGWHFEFNIRWTGAVCDFVNAANDQLSAGEVDRVRNEFGRFREGEFHETYESEWFLRRLNDATRRLRDDGN